MKRARGASELMRALGEPLVEACYLEADAGASAEAGRARGERAGGRAGAAAAKGNASAFGEAGGAACEPVSC